MATISETLRQQVAERARYLCEYCQTAQRIVVTMEIDHITPQAAGGQTTLDNLCLVCRGCNSFKRDYVTGIDPESNTEHPLFHPRTELWVVHFEWAQDGVDLRGLTPIGRATIARLQINREDVLNSRRLWVQVGLHPPKLD